MKNKSALILLLLSFLFHLPTFAQSWGKGVLEKSDFMLVGYVQDNLTREKLHGAKVEMFSYTDSLLFSYVIEPNVSFYEEPGGWAVPIPMEGQK